jgi:hypothetical protein
VFPLPCMLVCAKCAVFWHTRPRVQRAPGIPCALYFEEGKRIYKTSGEMRREIANLYSVVITREGEGFAEVPRDDSL